MKQVIRKYLIENNGSRIINEYNLSTNSKMSSAAKSRLMDCLADFMFERFGDKPDRQQKIDVCKATVALFPRFLKVKNSQMGGIVRIIYLNTIPRGKKSFDCI